jgi:hypothetical protein
MSIGKISAATFFAENGLFKLLRHKDGDITKSYKTKTQEYVMECENCGQQVEQRGNAEFECRRCRYSVAPSVENNAIVWKITEPSGLKKTRAEEAMEKPAKVLIKEDDSDDDGDGDDAGDSDDDDVIVPTIAAKKKPVPTTAAKKKAYDEAKPPSAAATVAFLKKTAPKVSGMRITERNKAHDAEQEADIDEPAIPVKPAPPQKPKEDLPKEVAPPCTVAVREVTMKVISLAPGQTHYCPVTNTLYMGAPA